MNSQLVADNREIRFDNTYYAPAQFTIEGAKKVTSVFSDAGKPAPSLFQNQEVGSGRHRRRCAEQFLEPDVGA